LHEHDGRTNELRDETKDMDAKFAELAAAKRGVDAVVNKLGGEGLFS
jgi:hypothetical protein